MSWNGLLIQPRDKAITRGDIQTKFGPTSVTPVPGVEGMDAELYTLLSSLCEGDALKMIMNVGSKVGLEAWKKLSHFYDPMTIGRRRNRLKHILNPSQAKLADLACAIETW